MIINANLAYLIIAVALTGCRAAGSELSLNASSEQAPLAVRGLIVNSEGTKRAWVVCRRGTIVAIETDESSIPEAAIKIRRGGVIFPGLIDTHNHAPWDVIPRWRAGQTFNNRYEWSEHDPAYLKEVNQVFTNCVSSRAVSDLMECSALKYAEIRALIGGTTMLQSSYGEAPVPGLVRPLGPSYLAQSHTLDIERITLENLKCLTNALSSGILRRVFLHVAEGKASDPETAGEFSFLESHGLVRDGVVVIHGVALNRPEFRKMATANMFLVWSPKSNLVLYGETSKILEALEEGVTVSLAPDWSITGSDNALAELKVAWDYSRTNLSSKLSPRQLFRMVTTEAAKVGGVEAFLGRVEPGYAADFFLAPELDPDPYLSLLKTQPGDIHLVVKNGRPIYGDMDIMDRLLGAGLLDVIEVDGKQKGLFVLGDPGAMPYYSQHFSNIVQTLSEKLPKLAPLQER